MFSRPKDNMDGDIVIGSEKLRDEILELRSNAFAALNKKMEIVKKIADNLTNTKGMHYKPQAVLEILQERKDILEKAFADLVSNFFVSIADGKFILRADSDLKNLKVITQTLKHELGLLNQKVDLFETMGKPEPPNNGSFHVGETICTSTNNQRIENGNEHGDMKLGLISIKLKIIRHYLVFAPTNNCTSKESELFEGRVRTPKELVRKKVIDLMVERRGNFEQARETSSDKSFIELIDELDKDRSFRVIWKNTFDRLKILTILLGTRLSLCVSEFLFVAVLESEGEVRRFQNCFKFLMRILVDECSSCKMENSCITTGKVLFLLEFAEKELIKIGVMKRELLLDDDEDFGPKEMSSREAEFDKVVNLLVKHVAWLESALSNPFSLGLHLEDDFTACYVEMASTRGKVHDLLGKRGEIVELMMTRFRQAMELKIAEKWANYLKSD